MHLLDLLTPARVKANVVTSGKKRLLEQLAAQLATGAEGENERGIYDSLCGRERLGSTGLGFVAAGVEADGGIGVLPDLVAVGLMARAPVERVLPGWEMPSAIPDDWMGNDYQQPRNPATVRDMKAAIES